MPARKVSVIVSARGRSSELDRCLCSLCCQDYFNYEIIVVDNAPENAKTRQLVDCFEGIRYVPQYRRGRRFVRHCGAAAATGEILVYVDDRWIAGAQWVSGIAAGTEAPRTSRLLFFTRRDVICRRPGGPAQSKRHPLPQLLDMLRIQKRHGAQFIEAVKTAVRFAVLHHRLSRLFAYTGNVLKVFFRRLV
jgi:glycosyltransferase involved in cell wall biosynthesis